LASCYYYFIQLDWTGTERKRKTSVITDRRIIKLPPVVLR
jgi:hypothetical protein